MNVETFSSWLQKQGYKVIQTPSSFWYQISLSIYQAFPYHQQIQPSESELMQLFSDTRAIGLRFSAPLKYGSGCISYHVVCNEKSYLLENLPKKARYDVRKGLKKSSIEQITFSRMANEGWELRLETLERQGRMDAESRTWWQDLCSCTSGLPGFEAWGAIDKNTKKLVASLIAFTCDDCFDILFQQSRTQHLSNGINNALTYVVTNQAVERPDIAYIFYGLHSLDAPGTVDKFKFRMGYDAKPVRQRVVFNPFIQPLINPVSLTAFRLGNKILPGISNLSKAEGMIQFYLQGNQPITSQVWPEALLKHKNTIISQTNSNGFDK